MLYRGAGLLKARTTFVEICRAGPGVISHFIYDDSALFPSCPVNGHTDTTGFH